MVDQFRPPAAADAQLVDLIRERALFARLETVRLISIAKTGHYASGFSCAEILATLYYGVMNLRRGEPDWPDRDRFLFGKGHAAATSTRCSPTGASSTRPSSTATPGWGAPSATIPT